MSERQEAEHTPGPWRWEMNIASKQVRLVGGKVRYDLNVMDFVRYGMSSASPRFNVERRENIHLMTRADELGAVVPGREHHADWFQAIDHPDANLIAAAAEMYEALLDIVENCEVIEKGTVIADFSRKTPMDKARAALAKAKGGAK